MTGTTPNYVPDEDTENELHLIRARRWLTTSWDLALVDDALSTRTPFMFSGPQACGKTYIEGALRQVLSLEDGALLWPHELQVNPQVLRIVIPFIGSGPVPYGFTTQDAVVRALEETLDYLADD